MDNPVKAKPEFFIFYICGSILIIYVAIE
jgi:hypothetical protein